MTCLRRLGLAAIAISTLPAIACAESVYDLPKPAFFAQARHDLLTLQRHAAGMERVLAEVRARPEVYTKPGTGTLPPDVRRDALTTWATIYAYFTSTEQLRQRYWDFVTRLPNDARHPWGFALTHAALASELARGLEFAALTQGNPQIEAIFDEADAELGLPARSYAEFKQLAIHAKTAAQLLSGAAWMPQAEAALRKHEAFDDARVAAAWAAIKRDSARALSRLGRQGVALFASNALDILRESISAAVFPAQSAFAEWLGDVRVRRLGQPLITQAQAEAVAARLEPGDVVVTRQNWFLSNIALPGFWPHAELYVGTPAELSAAFDADPAVIAWTRAETESAGSLSALLFRRFPDKWKKYADGRDFQGHGPIRVIEAISEGVSFTALEHAFGVDYLAALRPRVPKLDKAKAIARAFAFQGRPYDFDFDFLTDAALVCTEVVYKAYEPAAGMQGLPFRLVTVAGRKTLPATEIVKRFDAEGDRPDRIFDFIVFLDGREKTRDAQASDVAAFRATLRRPKWDVSQK